MPFPVAALLPHAKQVPSGKVYVVGHSLGAAIASIAALRLNRMLPKSAEVAGVWLFASPRSGNPAWKALYNAVLQHKTLRLTNYQDIAARNPKQQESCAVLGSSVINLLARTQQYAYAHVGRSVLMCPREDGLTHFDVSALGSEIVECPGAKDEVDVTFTTHVLGSYVDAWRRGYMAHKGLTLAGDARLAAVMCSECTMPATSLSQVAAPARAGGPVACNTDASCSNKLAWDAAASVRHSFTVAYPGQESVCNGFMCS